MLTLSGTNNPSLTVNSLYYSARTNRYTSIINLNAGTLAPKSIVSYTSSDAYTECKSYFNFNGGTLKYNSKNNPFYEKGMPTRITVFGGGAVLELNTTYSVAFSLLRPTGRGIKSIKIPDSAETTGYAMPPTVKITGDGESATAHVRFDPKTGTVEREIEVTCPGFGFTETPTVTITANDMKTVIECEVELTGEEQPDGGLTLRGSGSFVPNKADLTFDYTGPTIVEEGVIFYPQVKEVPNPFSTSKELRMAGGAYSAWNTNPTWRRVGGYGKTRAWDSNYLCVTEALFFRAQDLEKGLFLNHDAGKLHLKDEEGCVVEIDNLDQLTKDRYKLLVFSGTGMLYGTPKLAAADQDKWSLVYLEESKTLMLRRRHYGAIIVR